MSVAFSDALATAILHLLWQGTALALLAALALRLLPRQANGARYAVSLGALAACVLAFVGTFWVAYEAPRTSEYGALIQAVPGLGEEVLASLTDTDLARRFGENDLVALLWLAGVLLLGLRLLNGVRWGLRLKGQSSLDVPEPWLRTLDQLRRDQGVRHAVILRTSESVESPAIVGWLVPMILVPTSAFTALTPDQLRCVLAHELAHLRRYDHLVNAAQAWVEVLLFFHPAVWWLSNRVREEREYCCDVAALRVTGSPRLLAQALTRLESLRLHSPSMALAARSHRSPLMKRITRILDPQHEPRRTVGWGFSSLISVAVLALGAGVAHATDVPPVDAHRVGLGETLELAPKDEAEYRSIEARLLEAVQAGDLSVAEAQKTLAALRKSMLASDKPKDKPKADKKESIQQAVKKIEAAVAAGKLSKEEAKQKLVALEEKAGGVDAKPRDEANRGDDARKDQLNAAEMKIKQAVADGRLSKEEGRQKLQSFRKDVDALHEAEARRRRDAPDAPDADDRLDALGRQIDGESRRREGDFAREREDDPRVARLREVQAKIEAAVRSGDLSKEEAERKLIEVRQAMFRPAGDPREGGEVRERRAAPDREEDARVARFREVQAKIEAAVRSGDLSKEEAERKLIEVRREMFRPDSERREFEKRDVERSDRREVEKRDVERVDRREVERREVERSDRRDVDRRDMERVDRREVETRDRERMDRREVEQREIERTDRRDAEQRERDGTDRRDKQDVAPVVKRLDATKKHLMLEVAAGRMTEEEAKQIFAKVEKELAAAKQDKQDEQAKEEKVKRERR
ncbi:MAG: M48 family metalloprotease [Planctomycetota bacterium]|nr:M48 family metalloprotease [Planctomycetota bacterium]